MSEELQSRESHAKYDPAFHFLLVPLTFGLLIWSFYRHFQVRTLDSFFVSMAFFVLLVAIFKTRIYSLKVQDRLIRLEERLRLQSLGDDTLRARIPQLTERQLIALRFASDGEVSALAVKALDEKLSGKQIKDLIKTWRPDFFRV